MRCAASRHCQQEMSRKSSGPWPAANCGNAPMVDEADNIIRLARLNDAEPEWLHACMRTPTRALICNQANAVTALAGLFPNAFGFDEMLQAAVLTGPLDDGTALNDPVKAAGETAQRAIRDADISVLQNRLQHVGFKRMGWDTIHRALEVISVRNKFHPVRDYLGGLRWDGAERLPTFLPIYFGTADGAYEREIGRMFMVGMVARVMEPGCKADHLL